MDDELDKLIEQYSRIETVIRQRLHKLYNWNKPCECEGEEYISLIDDNYPGLTDYCLKCGGYIGW